MCINLLITNLIILIRAAPLPMPMPMLPAAVLMIRPHVTHAIISPEKTHAHRTHHLLARRGEFAVQNSLLEEGEGQ